MRAARMIAVAACVSACGSTAPTPARHPATAAQPAAAAAVAWSPQTFDAKFAAALGRAFPGATIAAHEATTFRVTRAQPPLHLEVASTKARASCEADWPHCQSAVDFSIAAAGEIARAQGAMTPAQVRVVLRSAAKITMVRSRGGAVALHPFSDDADWLLAIDTPNTIGLDVDPARLGMTADDAWKLGTANTAHAIGTPISQAANSFIVFQHDYAPSAMLAPDTMIAAVKLALPGRTGQLLAIAPEENILLYTLGGEAEIATLAKVGTDGAKASQMPLSAHVMAWDGTAWHTVR